MIDGISTRLGGLGAPNVSRIDDAARAAARPAIATIAAAGSGKAELSALAVAAHDAGQAPVDASRIAALKAAIADGSYTVDPEKIAARMITLDLGWAADA